MTTSHQDGLPVPEDWLHLKPYGYAPGNYMSRCLDCKATPIMDKRACRCRPCAEAAYAKAESALAELECPPDPETVFRQLDFDAKIAKAASLIRAMGERATTYQVQSALEAAAKMLEEME